MNPTTGIAGCCARAASGHAVAPPSSVMNSRRFTMAPVLPTERIAHSARHETAALRDFDPAYDHQCSQRLRRMSALPPQIAANFSCAGSSNLVLSLSVIVPDCRWRVATVHKPDRCHPAPALSKGDALCSTTAERLSLGRAFSACPCELSKFRLFSPIRCIFVWLDRGTRFRNLSVRSSCTKAGPCLSQEFALRLLLGPTHTRRNSPRHRTRLSKPIVS